MINDPTLNRIEDNPINDYFPDAVQDMLRMGLISLKDLAEFLVSTGFKRSSAFEAAKRYLRITGPNARYPYNNKVGRLLYEHMNPHSTVATLVDAKTQEPLSFADTPPLLPDNPFVACEIGKLFPMVARALVVAGIMKRQDIRRIAHRRYKSRLSAKAAVFNYVHMRDKHRTYPFDNAVGREIARHPAFVTAWQALTTASPDQQLAAERSALGEQYTPASPKQEEVTAPARLTPQDPNTMLYEHLIKHIPKAKKQAEKALSGEAVQTVARFIRTLGNNVGEDLIRIHSITGRPGLKEALDATQSATDRKVLTDIGIITAHDPNLLVAKFVEVYNNKTHRAALNNWAELYLSIGAGVRWHQVARTEKLAHVFGSGA